MQVPILIAGHALAPFLSFFNPFAASRILLGAQRPLVLSEAERRIVAYHEAGHALVAHYQPLADRVSGVTILPRGQSLGVMQFVAEEDRYNYSRDYLMARLAVGLGGRAAEELAFGPERVTTGAENDLQAVTGLARRKYSVCSMRATRRPARSGSETLMCRSKRPGRSRAASRMSARLVAASTTMVCRDANPSSSTSNWLSV